MHLLLLHVLFCFILIMSLSVLFSPLFFFFSFLTKRLEQWLAFYFPFSFVIVILPLVEL